ncbi:cell wall hydrolase [Altererythrobacter aerius]|uniref:Cell wall hydrolase n=1 Tax=Tsuneonella aeria TaxID=1837929 RepID=A0A6I4TFK7_9SPHN|nr:cell wall hydrolase [Tsuneonella aeria]MXO75417.1 cell wall hydrolase [Tsuneonella aeria]
MQFHRSTVAAIAATCLLTLFAADGSGANAEIGENPTPVTAPALTDETVPVAPPVSFVSEAVVQPVSDTDAEPAPPSPPKSGSLKQLVANMPAAGTLSREMECLAGAIYFEARGEPLEGQLAVAQVVINRSESGMFPKSYCGVVYQPKQFSFIRGGRMPSIERGSPAWRRATAMARIAHEELWESKADDALFFHARYVSPSWSRTKVARATIDSHIFYR